MKSCLSPSRIHSQQRDGIQDRSSNMNKPRHLLEEIMSFVWREVAWSELPPLHYSLMDLFGKMLQYETAEAHNYLLKYCGANCGLAGM